MKKKREQLLREALELHTNAAAKFALLAQDVPPERWCSSSDDKKWTAAELTEHLTLVYKILLRELSGDSGMKVVTNFWQKALARWFILPKIMNAAIFPKGARAPQETRPVNSRGDQQAAITAFEELAQTFQQKVQIAYRQDPNTGLTHAYFGRFTLENAVLLCAQHVLHHSNQLQS